MPTTSFAQSLHEKSGGAIPSESATPEEVRMYITELLIDDYFTPPNEAKQHASKWEIGRCSQLFLNTEETQRRIFGENVGLCIHRALQQRMRALWEKESSVVYSKCMYYCFHLMSSLLTSLDASIVSGILLMTITPLLFFTLDLSKPERMFPSSPI